MGSLFSLLSDNRTQDLIKLRRGKGWFWLLKAEGSPQGQQSFNLSIAAGGMVLPPLFQEEGMVLLTQQEVSEGRISVTIITATSILMV